MSLEVKAGARLRSAACTTEVVVIRAPGGSLDLRCGGTPMVALDDEVATGQSVKAPFDSGSAIGKRYVNAAGDLELLCTKAGAGSLSVGDEILEISKPKPLPASD